MNNRTKNAKNIDIFEYLRTLCSYWILLLVAALIVGSVFYVRAKYFTTPVYVSDGTLYVSGSEDDVYVHQNVDVNDIYAAKILVYTYVEMVQTRSFLEAVSDELPFDCSWQAIKGMLKVSMVNDTELLRVTVTSSTPEMAYQINKAYLEVVPKKLAEMFAKGGVWVIDPALYPTSPRKADAKKAGTLGGLLGVVIAAAIVLFLEIFNNKFKKREDIEERYNIPVLGEFYAANRSLGRLKKLGIKTLRLKTPPPRAEQANQAVLSESTDFATVETYKSIRTNIMFSMPKTDKGRIIAVTSASPGDGKSTTMVNLAITFAQTGARVILVDCDLRKPHVHQYLGVNRLQGVTNVVCGYAELKDAIKRDVQPNLDCLTAGENAPNPAELLDSKAFDTMLERLQEDYDYILIDAPPITVVTDAALVLKRDAAAILVARQDSTTYDIFDKAVNEVEITGAKIIGALFLSHNQSRKKYGYRSYRYGARYGYRYANHYYEQQLGEKND